MKFLGKQEPHDGNVAWKELNTSKLRLLKYYLSHINL